MKNRIYLQGFEDGKPFIPTCKEVVYIPFSGSEILDSFFRRNLESVKDLFRKKLGYEFIFIPEVVGKYSKADTLRYFHPLADIPTSERIKFVEQDLINSLLHNDDGKMLSPGLIHFMQTELFSVFEGEHEGCFEFSYVPLEDGDDAFLMMELRNYVEFCGESYGHINYGHPDIWQYSEADRSFYSAQQRYFKQFANKDVCGITRLIIDSLAGREEMSHMEVDAEGQITLSDFGIGIDMCPAARAIYLLFLRHSEGIVLADMEKYAKELAMICEQLAISDEDDLRIIAYSLNSDSDVIDQLCGEIYASFREKLDGKAAAHYIIQAAPYDFGKGYRRPYIEMGEPKKIILDRSLVSWHRDFSPKPFEHLTKA